MNNFFVNLFAVVFPRNVSLNHWGRLAPLLARSGLMQQTMDEILYIIKREDKSSKEVQDGKRNWANSARRYRTLVKSRT